MEERFVDALSESALMEFILYNNWANPQVLEAVRT